VHERLCRVAAEHLNLILLGAGGGVRCRSAFSACLARPPRPLPPAPAPLTQDFHVQVLAVARHDLLLLLHRRCEGLVLRGVGGWGESNRGAGGP
jgi:hypothetical protein